MITVLGRIFSGLFFVSLFQPVGTLLPGGEPARPVNPDTRGRVSLHSYPHQEMTPDIRRGSFLFLGFNHWVTSLSVESTGFVDRSPFRGKLSSSASFVFRLYVKRKMLSPAYRCTFHVWCHLFYDNSLSRRKPFCKMEKHTNNFRINGIKRRSRNFLT